MNNTPRWESHVNILKYFPDNISVFAEAHGYQYNAEQFMYHQRIILKASDHYIECHRAKNSSHLGYVTVTKKLPWNSPLVRNARITLDFDLPSALKPEQFFPFVNEQVIKQLKNIQL